MTKQETLLHLNVLKRGLHADQFSKFSYLVPSREQAVEVPELDTFFVNVFHSTDHLIDQQKTVHVLSSTPEGEKSKLNPD